MTISTEKLDEKIKAFLSMGNNPTDAIQLTREELEALVSTQEDGKELR